MVIDGLFEWMWVRLCVRVRMYLSACVCLSGARVYAMCARVGHLRARLLSTRVCLCAFVCMCDREKRKRKREEEEGCMRARARAPVCVRECACTCVRVRVCG
jgi:hypothetical protein